MTQNKEWEQGRGTYIAAARLKGSPLKRLTLTGPSALSLQVWTQTSCHASPGPFKTLLQFYMSLFKEVLRPVLTHRQGCPRF